MYFWSWCLLLNLFIIFVYLNNTFDYWYTYFAVCVIFLNDSYFNKFVPIISWKWRYLWFFKIPPTLSLFRPHNILMETWCTRWKWATCTFNQNELLLMYINRNCTVTITVSITRNAVFLSWYEFNTMYLFFVSFFALRVYVL